MATWKWPVEAPRFTDEKMKKAKAEYVAEHGYEVHLPGITEIITLFNYTEPSSEELSWYYDKNYTQLSTTRYNEIDSIVKKKRERYKRMLASPTPTWVTNIGSVMTWFDDMNDLFGTLGVVFRTLAFLLPKSAMKLFLGPAGWFFLAADLFGVLLDLMRMPLSCVSFKRDVETIRDANPFSKKSRLRRASKLRRFFPSIGEIIEGLQTTDQIFGRGLCLGPILGAAYDLYFGTYRAVRGERVSFKVLPPDMADYEKLAFKSIRHLNALGLGADELLEEDHMRVVMAYCLAMQAIKGHMMEWNPLDQVEGLDEFQIPAESPEYPSTRAVLEEFGIGPFDRIGWPFIEKEYVTYQEIWDTYNEKATESSLAYCERNSKNEQGLVVAQNMLESGLMAMANAEGINPIDLFNLPSVQAFFDWTNDGCKCKTYSTMYTTGYPVTGINREWFEDMILEWECAADIGTHAFVYHMGGDRYGRLSSYEA